MPTYDYECDACQHAWELFQKITDDPIQKCPQCGKKKARRLFGTGAAIMFKGSGFYETDYRSAAYKKSAKADSKSSADEAANTSSSSSGNNDPKSGKDSGSGDSSSGNSKTDSPSTTKEKSPDPSPSSNAKPRSTGRKKPKQD